MIFTRLWINRGAEVEQILAANLWRANKQEWSGFAPRAAASSG